jgi:hypothetical protein
MGSPRRSEKTLLSSLGADEGNFLFEAIVSTCDSAGKPNAAPMGIRFTEDKTGKKKILIKPYKATATHKNLTSQREAVVNITSEPEVYFATTFKRDLLLGSEIKPVFSKSRTVKPPRIKGCDAYIEVSVSSLRDAEGEEDRSDVLCDLKLVEIKKHSAKLYCRAPYILMEMMIHATRVREFVSKGLKDEAVEPMKLIENYMALIHRVAPGSRYEMMALLVMENLIGR